jgi:Mrp family chromosome partitioning ATPase
MSAPLQERFAGLVHLHSSAPQVPIIAILDSDDEKAAIQSLDLGAAAYCLKKKCDIDLSGVIRSAVKKERQPAGSIAVDKPRFLQTAEIISVFGAKGGVGTSTVALNLASALAQKDKVILAELTRAFGTLGQYFGLHDRAPGIASFKEMPSDLIADGGSKGLSVVSQQAAGTEHFPWPPDSRGLQRDSALHFVLTRIDFVGNFRGQTYASRPTLIDWVVSHGTLMFGVSASN